ncbi:MAG: hypothetical protein JSR91_09405 [Proteobacteria bacterium]|nr:hypothetical protein [Pseudomonadota bacterium]
MEIVGKKLATCQVDEAGEWFRLHVEAEDGTPSALILPMDCVRSLLMTLPGMIERALKARYRDASMKLVYPMGDWAVESDVHSDARILTLATPDGFRVAFAMTPESADNLGASLVDTSEETPFDATVN